MVHISCANDDSTSLESDEEAELKENSWWLDRVQLPPYLAALATPRR